MTSAWLGERQGELADAVAGRLAGKPGSAYAVVGADACRDHALAALAALQADLPRGKTDALRPVVRALVDALVPHGLGFADLRSFVHALRGAVLGALAADAGAERAAVDAWFLELGLVCATHFVVAREAAAQQRAAEVEVHHLASQLGELQAALAEKSALLERVRQTSTPIAPVVAGILVVPLVGVFDGLRAELLTERLLQAVGQARARVVILDISGVPVFDAEAADLTLRLAGAVRLLGSELILVGVSPATAATMVELDLDLRSIRALATLQDGLALALRLQRLRIAPL